MDGTHVLVTDDEATHGQTFADDVGQVFDAVTLVAGFVVFGDHAAGDDAAEVVEGLEGGFEVFAADVFVVDVDAVGGETLEGRRGGFLLVVESGVESEIFGDEFELLVGSDGSDDGESLVFAHLAHYLTDGSGGGGDKDGFAFSGLADLVQGRVCGESGHAKASEEVAEIGDSIGIVQLVERGDGAECASRIGREDGVLLDVESTVDDIARLKFIGSRLQDLCDCKTRHGFAEVEGGAV